MLGANAKNSGVQSISWVLQATGLLLGNSLDKISFQVTQLIGFVIKILLALENDLGEVETSSSFI